MATATHKGVDLSHHNDPVDFGTLKAGGVEFVALKATEGTGYVDPTFADRRRRAQLVGFQHVLLYHFVHPAQSTRAQVANLVTAIGKLAPNERIVLDVEPTPGRDEWVDFGPNGSALRILALVTYLKEAFGLSQSDLILYGSLGWLRGQFGDQLSSLAFMPLWDAHYAPSVGDTTPFRLLLWQDSEHGTQAGAGEPGQIDTDVWMDAGAW